MVLNFRGFHHYINASQDFTTKWLSIGSHIQRATLHKMILAQLQQLNTDNTHCWHSLKSFCFPKDFTLFLNLRCSFLSRFCKLEEIITLVSTHCTQNVGLLFPMKKFMKIYEQDYLSTVFLLSAYFQIDCIYIYMGYCQTKLVGTDDWILAKFVWVLMARDVMKVHMNAKKLEANSLTQLSHLDWTSLVNKGFII